MGIDAETYAAAKGYTDKMVEGGGGTLDYEALRNHPSINGNELVGNKSSKQLGIQNLFTGTTAEWAQLTADQKAQYTHVCFTDDTAQEVIVVANPEAQATEELTKLQVGQEVYSIPSGEAVADNTSAIEAIVNEYGACNLCPNDMTSDTYHDIVYTVNADDTISLSGTASTTTDRDVTERAKLKAGTYKVSGCPVGGGESTYLLMVWNDTTQQYIAFDSGSGASFTITSDSTLQVTLRVYGGVNVDGKVFKPMLYDARLKPTGYVSYAMTNQELTPYALSFSNEPNNITNRLANLPTAISEQNLEKYGYKIGDYFDGSVSGYRYWLGQLDYNYGGYDSYAILGSHNIGLVVDTKSNSQWNTTDDTTGGGENCVLQVYLRGTVLDNIKADMVAMFGTWNDHILPETKLFPLLADWTWSTNPEYISALTECNIYGCALFSADSFQQGEGVNQLDIFRKYKHNRIFGKTNVWLRSIASATHVCFADDLGRATSAGASLNFRAVGLILFH